MRRIAVLFLTLALAASNVTAKPLKPLTQGGSWDVSGARMADVTCDGRPDIIMTGHAGKTLLVSVVPGGRKNRAFDFSFGIDSGRQDAVCALPVHIVTEKLTCEDDEYGHLEGCRPMRRCMMFAVADGLCDSLWFYWNAKARRIDWYRH